MDLLPIVQRIQTEAALLSSGNETARTSLLHAIQKLTLAVESPTQTLMRISFQVGVSNNSMYISIVKNELSENKTACSKCIDANCGRDGTSSRYRCEEGRGGDCN